jgi:pimeloyl-ACP methyl ester carboxylesterase
VTGAASDAARQFASIEGGSCPGDDSVTIADAGHMLHFEAPAALAAAIEAFFSNHL